MHPIVSVADRQQEEWGKALALVRRMVSLAADKGAA